MVMIFMKNSKYKTHSTVQPSIVMKSIEPLNVNLLDVPRNWYQSVQHLEMPDLVAASNALSQKRHGMQVDTTQSSATLRKLLKEYDQMDSSQKENVFHTVNLRVVQKNKDMYTVSDKARAAYKALFDDDHS